MKCRLIRPLQAGVGSNRTLPVGHVIDHPEAFYLCQMGHADPVDDECIKATNRTPEQLLRARHAANKVVLGIAPEDYEAFDAGLMTGYDESGNWIPGPNYQPEDDEDEEEEPDDE